MRYALCVKSYALCVMRQLTMPTHNSPLSAPSIPPSPSLSLSPTDCQLTTHNCPLSAHNSLPLSIPPSLHPSISQPTANCQLTTLRSSLHPSIPPSPRLPFSPSPFLQVSPSPTDCHRFLLTKKAAILECVYRRFR